MSGESVSVTRHGDAFLVRVGGAAGTEHRVTVPAGEAGRLGTTAEDLVAASFHFLLEREPKEAILGVFDLAVIERYFPEYRGWIERRFGGG
jgi:hypothetical protein